MAFFRGLGFDFNPQFTDATAACMVIADDIFAMLLTEPKFCQFTPKQICDTRTSTEVLIALSRDSREAVDRMAAAALAGGGTTYGEPKDHGFMYYHAFSDLDGHNWEVMNLEPGAVQGG